MKVHFSIGDFIKLLADSGGDEPPEYGTIESIDSISGSVVVRVGEATDVDSGLRDVSLDEIAPLSRNDKRMVQLIDDLQAVRSAKGFNSIIRQIQRILRQEAVQLHLSSIEREIINYVAAGLTTKEIGVQMKCPEATIETYRVRLLRKLNVRNVAEMISYAYKHRILRS